MFAQKKKRSKLWFALPAILLLAAGLWLNAGLEDSGSDSLMEESSVPAGSDQYEENISDLAGQPDTSYRNEDADLQETQKEGQSKISDDDMILSDEGYNANENEYSGDYGSGYYDYDAEYDNRYGEYREYNGYNGSAGQQNVGGNNSGNDQRETPKNSGSSSSTSEEKSTGKIVVITDNDGGVVILRYDSSGKIASQTETSIILSMLTETDQKLFARGITVSDESELSELLQDFEG